jgi:hypothetical protein
MKMTKAELAFHTAQVIQFPSCRIVRRIEHGRPVDEQRHEPAQRIGGDDAI